MSNSNEKERFLSSIETLFLYQSNLIFGFRNMHAHTVSLGECELQVRQQAHMSASRSTVIN